MRFRRNITPNGTTDAPELLSPSRMYGDLIDLQYPMISLLRCSTNLHCYSNAGCIRTHILLRASRLLLPLLHFMHYATWLKLTSIYKIPTPYRPIQITIPITIQITVLIAVHITVVPDVIGLYRCHRVIMCEGVCREYIAAVGYLSAIGLLSRECGISLPWGYYYGNGVSCYHRGRSLP